MKMQENYQAVVIKFLLNKSGKANREEIAAELNRYNMLNPNRDFRYVAVYQVLLENKIVSKIGTEFTLNFQNLNLDEIKQLVLICNIKMRHYLISINEQLEKAQKIYLTFFNHDNLLISKKQGLLGWKQNEKNLSRGSLIFVYDTSEQRITTCFMIANKLNKMKYVWKDELLKGEIIYNNRWSAKLLTEMLDIPLETINSTTPFNNQRFNAFFRTRRPILLTSDNNLEKYREFSNLLLLQLKEMKNHTTISFSSEIHKSGNVKSLQINDFYHKKEIQQNFGVGAFGGIRVNTKRNLVVIFIDALPARKITSYGKNIYHDKYDKNAGLYFYTGQGQLGDQQLLRGGNKWLFNAISNSKIKVHLLRQYYPGGKHEYLGIVRVLRYNEETQEDANSNKRKVIIFTLEPLSYSNINEGDAMYREIESEINYNESPSDDLLEKQVELISNTISVEGAKSKLKSIERSRIENIRAQNIIVALKLLYKTYCQVCNKEHFKTPIGVYSEVHHIIEWHISHDDTRENLVVICADCHRKFHNATKNEIQSMYDNLCRKFGHIKYKKPRILSS
jgi:5-methylcytosine-specific restriction protein A